MMRCAEWYRKHGPTGGASSNEDRATRPTAQAPAGLGDTASIPCAVLDSVLAQLRHAYAHLTCDRVKNQSEFARGLIAPQIRKLERLRNELGKEVK